MCIYDHEICKLLKLKYFMIINAHNFFHRGNKKYTDHDRNVHRS